MIIKYQKKVQAEILATDKIRKFTGNMSIENWNLSYRIYHEFQNEKGGFYREVAAEYPNKNEAEKALYEIIEAYESKLSFYELQ